MRPVILLLALALLAPAAAEGCTPTTSEPIATAGPVYLAQLFCQGAACIFSIFVYTESNGIDGLQRQDEAHDDTCGGQIAGDTIIF